MEALAGTGKTTTAVGCLSQVNGQRAGFVAFNQHIARELQSRLPQGLYASTLHSLGFAACRKAFPGVEVDEQKLPKLARELAPDLYPSDRQAAEQLCRLRKYTFNEDYEELADHYNIDLSETIKTIEKVLDLADRLFYTSAEQTRVIDFDDMIHLPVHRSLKVNQFDLLIVDEAQDLNRCQQELAKQATRTGRLCPIGDRFQSIYGFSGADTEALPRLAGELQAAPCGGKILPLTVTWRCPVSHVELARRIVPSLEAAPGAAEGVIRTAERGEIAKEVVAGDLVICRKNAPVVGLTYHLVLAGVKAVMRGRDISKGLVGLINRLKPNDVADLIRRLARYEEREERRLIERDAPTSAYQALEDRCSCLGQLAAQAESLDALVRFIEQTFSDTEKPGAAVVLSSVHRAKGLEAERVFVLDPASLPLSHRDQKSWERAQERHICYIASTRSKRELIFEDEIPAIFRS